MLFASIMIFMKALIYALLLNSLIVTSRPLIPDGVENDRPKAAVALSFNKDLTAISNFLQVHHSNVIDKDVHYVGYRGGGLHGTIGSGTLPEDIEVPFGVTPLRLHRYNQFVGEVKVGTPPQPFDVIFDTGSTNIWIVDDECTARSCQLGPQFHRYNSSTFQAPDTNIVDDIHFGTGEIFGSSAKDKVQVGPFVLPNQSIHLVKSELYPTNTGVNIFEAIGFQGILGLAFPSMASNGEKPILDRILDKGFIDFSFYVSPDISEELDDDDTEIPSAAVLFNGHAPEFYVAPIRYVPVIREHYWEVALLELWVGDEKFCCDEKSLMGKRDSYVIFDSGTVFNTFPVDDFKEFAQVAPLELPCMSTSDDTLIAEYPSITYILDNELTIRLDPEMYLVQDMRRHRICRPAFMSLDVPSEFGHAFILGSYSFMRFYYTNYIRGSDGQPSMVGVAKAQSGHKSRYNLQSLLQLSNS